MAFSYGVSAMCMRPYALLLGILLPVLCFAQSEGDVRSKQVAPQSSFMTYRPLPNGEVAATGPGRHQWVLQHPTAAGTPSTCKPDWSGSGPLSNDCAKALFEQAQAERAAGNCVAALTDYDNAKQAAQNGGTIVIMSLQQQDGRTECSNKLNPPKPEEGAAYGAAGTMPVGRYTCYSAPAVIANGGAYGRTAVQIGQWQGYIWIFDDHRYAAPYSDKDAGTYRMQGNNIVAVDGPYGPKRNKTQLEYLPHGVYGRPTIHLAFLDDNGKPIAGTACTHDGPPAAK